MEWGSGLGVLGREGRGWGGDLLDWCSKYLPRYSIVDVTYAKQIRSLFSPMG